MSTPQTTSRRRIDRLKAKALALGFSKDYAKQYGKLSKTDTWEKLLTSYGIQIEAANSEPFDKTSRDVEYLPTTCNSTRPNSSFLDWVDFGQLAALIFASVGTLALAASLWRQLKPFDILPPVRITIQIGVK